MRTRISLPLIASLAVILGSHARAQIAQTASSASGEQAVVMSPFEVSTKGDRGYNTTNTVGATLINTPMQDTPTSIAVLNAQFINDVGAGASVTAASSYVSGVVPCAAPGSGQLSVRGQDITTGANIRDGILDSVSVGGLIFQDNGLLDRIEIIKGPEGTLYGSYSGQGGLANLVTKSPEPVNRTVFTAFVGADDFGGTTYRGLLDTTGTSPVSKDLQYRFILIGQRGKTITDGPDDTFVVAPMGRYEFPGGGNLLLRYTYQNPDWGINEAQWFSDSAGNLSTFIPAKTTYTESNTGANVKIHTVDFAFTQPFQTGPVHWDARYYFRYNHVDLFRQYFAMPATAFLFQDANGNTFGNQNTALFTDPRLTTIYINPRTVNTFAEYVEAGNNNIDLVGSFDIGPAKNKILMYGSQLRMSDDSYTWAGTYPGIYVWSLNPQTYPIVHQSNPGATQIAAGGEFLAFDTDKITTLNSIGAQDNISFWDDRVNLMAAIRYDRQNQTTINYFGSQFIPADIRTGTTKKFGGVVRLIDPISAFYNYSQTFAPAGFAPDIRGIQQKLPNLNSTMNEEGLKLDLLHDTVVLTGSYFRTVVANATVLLQAVNSSGLAVQIFTPAGQQVIQGWEMDGTAALSNNLYLLFGAGNLTSKTQTGLEARGVVFGTNYRLFAKYVFAGVPGWLHGLSVGAGLQHNGARAGDAANDMFLGPYTIVNALIAYQLDRHWSAQVNVNNVTNTNYASVAVNRTTAYKGNPRDASFTLTYAF